MNPDDPIARVRRSLASVDRARRRHAGAVDEARARAARRKRPRTLGTDAIVDVALRLVDTEGVDSVSMRRIAAEFDTGPASLYAHVANKEELLQLVLVRVLDEVPIPSGDTWQELVRGHAHAVREVFIRHNDVARLSFGLVPDGDRLRDIAETVLAAMIEGGVPPQVAAWAIDVTSLYIAADVYEGWLMAQMFDDGSGRPTEEVGQQYFAEFGKRMAELPAGRYPYLTRHVDEMVNGSSDDRFAFGIDMLIAGFAAQATPTPPPTRATD